METPDLLRELLRRSAKSVVVRLLRRHARGAGRAVGVDHFGLLLGVEGGTCVVKPFGHKKSERVPAKAVRLFISRMTPEQLDIYREIQERK